MSYGQEIGEKERVDIAQSEYVAKRPRYVGVEGIGTFATQVSAKIVETAHQFAATKFFQHALALDNNSDSINKAVMAASKLRPGFRLFKPKDSFESFFVNLPGKGRMGFNRSLEQSTLSMPRYYGTIRRSIDLVKEHDKKCGTQLSMQIRPTSLSGGHAGSPQWLFNYELRSQKFDTFKIGLATIPNDIVSIQVFKKVLPLMNAMKNYGLDCWILWDNSMSRADRSVAEQDEIVLRGLLATFTAFAHDPSLPGPGDVWNALAAESSFIGVAGAKEPLAITKKALSRVSDREVSIEAVRRGMVKVLEDRKSMFLDAKLDKSSAGLIAISGNIGFGEYYEAVSEVLKPRSVTTVFAPSSDENVTITRFFPLKSHIKSINRIFKTGRVKPNNGLLVPSDVVEESIGSVWEYVEKTADFVGIEPEELLKG